MIKLIQGNCIDVMEQMQSNYIDLTVTSPPYDNLRTYNNSSLWNESIWKAVIRGLYKVTKKGGVVVWVVNDATIKGSETGTSFKQALYFKEIGFNLHDTMIYRKNNYLPLTHKRYEQSFEYMFIFTKQGIKTFNPIKIKCIYEKQRNARQKVRTADGRMRTMNSAGGKSRTKIKHNIFSYNLGKTSKHPAIFPDKLAEDHIISWSNEKDLVFDPFTGSGTVGAMAKKLNRDFIGIEIDESYLEIAKQRINK